MIESSPIRFLNAYSFNRRTWGEEWLLRIEDLHMEAWRDIYMPKDVLPDEDTENWEVAYCEAGEKEKSVGRGVYPENWKEF